MGHPLPRLLCAPWVLWGLAPDVAVGGHCDGAGVVFAVDEAVGDVDEPESAGDECEEEVEDESDFAGSCEDCGGVGSGLYGPALCDCFSDLCVEFVGVHVGDGSGVCLVVAGMQEERSCGVV